MKRRLGADTLGPAVCMALLAIGPLLPVSADTPDISVTPIARDGQVLVTFNLSDGFTADVRDAIQSGLPTTFSYVVELRQGTASWFDRTLSAVTIAATVRFDNLTRRYQMSRSFGGGVEAARSTDDQDAVRRWMTHFDRVPVSTTATLEANGEYYVRVRARTRRRGTWFFWPWDHLTVHGRAKFTFSQ
jgi:Domain of unknown function (DUF4390)